MGKLKDEATANVSEDVTQHKLLDSEANFLRLLNLSLQFHTMNQKIMSNFLYYICTQRLGYKDGVNLQFEFNFQSEDNMLTVKLLPASAFESPAPSDEPTGDTETPEEKA